MTDLPLRPAAPARRSATSSAAWPDSASPSPPTRPGRSGRAPRPRCGAFQSRRGLRVDGICGDQTWASLVEAGYRLGDRLALPARADAPGRRRRRAPAPARRRSASTPAGSTASSARHRPGRSPTSSATPACTTDGICGPATAAELSGSGARPHRGRPRSPACGRSRRCAAAPPSLLGRRIAVGESRRPGAAGRRPRPGPCPTPARSSPCSTTPTSRAQAAEANDFEAEVYRRARPARPSPAAGRRTTPTEAFESVGRPAAGRRSSLSALARRPVPRRGRGHGHAAAGAARDPDAGRGVRARPAGGRRRARRPAGRRAGRRARRLAPAPLD